MSDMIHALYRYIFVSHSQCSRFTFVSDKFVLDLVEVYLQIVQTRLPPQFLT